MEKRLLVLLASLAASSLFVCRPSLSLGPGADLAAAEAAVRKADADWAAAASTASVDAWMAFYATDAIVLLPKDHLASGKELVRSTVTHLLALPHLLVTWHPIKVEMTRSGDLAYLIGAYDLRFGDSRVTPVTDRGRLLEIWRKQTDGTWKCIVDTWNSDEPTAAASPAAPPAAPPAAEVTASAPPAPDSETGPLTPAQVLAAKYGDMPIHYEEKIRQYFQEHLKNPNSVQYQDITQPEKGYTTAVTGTFLMRETRDYGWTVKATINAKNSHGSYVGFKRYTFLFRGENIIHTLSPLTSDEMI